MKIVIDAVLLAGLEQLVCLHHFMCWHRLAAVPPPTHADRR